MLNYRVGFGVFCVFFFSLCSKSDCLLLGLGQYSPGPPIGLKEEPDSPLNPRCMSLQLQGPGSSVLYWLICLCSIHA